LRLPLANDAWAELRPPESIPRKAAKAYRKVFFRVAAASAEVADGPDYNPEDPETQRAMGKALLQSGSLDVMEDLADALVLAVVAEWSFGPVDQDHLDEVPEADLAAIQRETGTQEYQDVLNPDFTNPTQGTDSPTSPSDS
jgi:hypothetical protein